MRLFLIASLFQISDSGWTQPPSEISQSLTLNINYQKTSAVTNPIALSVGMVEQKKAEGTSNTISIGQRSTSSTAAKMNGSHSDVEQNQIASSIPRYYALILAIDDYAYESNSFRDLQQPLKDGAKLYETLLDYNFSKETTLFVKNPSRNQIIEAFENLSKTITPSDNLLIFYAGHGVWDERLKLGYWLPADARHDNKSNWIANSTLRDYIAGISTKHTLLISDACFSGSIFRTRDVQGINEYAVSKLYKLPSRKAMTSGTLTTVPDQSKFMEYFLKRLNENREKYLTAKQLFASLENAVLNNSSTVPQFGTIQDTGDEGGDFVFIRNQ